jgi:hypothetical protein
MTPKARATKKKFEDLSDPQVTVLSALLEGATVTAAATRAGVSRQTASTWRNRDPVFMAVLNSGRLDVWLHVQDRLRTLVGKSLDVLEKQLEQGDVSVAKAILRSAEKLNLDKIGPTDPQLMLNEITMRDQAIFWEQLTRNPLDPVSVDDPGL